MKSLLKEASADTANDLRIEYLDPDFIFSGSMSNEKKKEKFFCNNEKSDRNSSSINKFDHNTLSVGVPFIGTENDDLFEYSTNCDDIEISGEVSFDRDASIDYGNSSQEDANAPELLNTEKEKQNILDNECISSLPAGISNQERVDKKGVLPTRRSFRNQPIIYRSLDIKEERHDDSTDTIKGRSGVENFISAVAVNVNDAINMTLSEDLLSLKDNACNMDNSGNSTPSTTVTEIDSTPLKEENFDEAFQKNESPYEELQDEGSIFMGLKSTICGESIDGNDNCLEGPEDSLLYSPQGSQNSPRNLRSTTLLSRAKTLPSILNNTPSPYWLETNFSTKKTPPSVNNTLFQRVTRNSFAINAVTDPQPFSQIPNSTAVTDISCILGEDDSVQRMEDDVSNLHSMQDTEIPNNNFIEKLRTTTTGCGINCSDGKQTCIDQKAGDDTDISPEISKELSISVCPDEQTDYIHSTNMLPSDLNTLLPPAFVYLTVTDLTNTDCGEKVKPLLAELSTLSVDVVDVILKCVVKRNLYVLDAANDLCEIFMRKTESKRSVKNSTLENSEISGNTDISVGKKVSSKEKIKECKNMFMSQAQDVIKALQKLTNNKEHRLGGDLSVAKTVSSSSLLLVYLLLEVQWITDKGFDKHGLKAISSSKFHFDVVIHKLFC